MSQPETAKTVTHAGFRGFVLRWQLAFKSPITMSRTSHAKGSVSFAKATPPKLTPMLAAKLVMTAVLWGGAFIAGKITAQAMPVMTAAFGRFLVASILLVLVAMRFEGGLPRLNGRQIWLTALLGLAGIFLYNVFFFGALARIPAGRAALFIALNPIVTALAARIFLRDRLSGRQWLGIAIALLGAVVVIVRGDFAGAMSDIGQSFGLGEMMICGAVLSWVAYTLASRHAMATLSPIAATTYASLWGLLFMGIGAANDILTLEWAALDWQVWLSLLYIGALGTVAAFIWYYQGIQAIGPARTAVFTNLVPVSAVLLSAVLLGEPILISMLVGGALALLGVSLTNRR